MDSIKSELNNDRRQFIKNVLKGTISGSLLLVIPAGADILKMPEQIAGIRDKEWEMSKQNFAFIVDITVCIGCGSCVVADKREYRCRTATTGHGWSAMLRTLMMKSMWIRPMAGWRDIRPPARIWQNRSETRFSCPNSATCAKTHPVFKSARWAPRSDHRTDLF